MAIANQAPHIEAQQARQAALERRMNSADPVERWQAREQLIGSYAAQMGRQMAAQAEKSASAYQAELRRCEEADAQYIKYAPLPKGAKVTK